VGIAKVEFGALEARLETQRLEVEAALAAHFGEGRTSAVGEAARFSLFGPAKRLRPILSMLVSELLGGEPGRVLPAACAVEMVHSASLILDDLPCMDDARLRRGRETCHVRYGQATAVLAAFALQNRAFELLAGGWPGDPGEAVRCSLARDLARAIGLDGMIAGQHRDLEMTDKPLDFATLEFIHSRKTGALFMASAAVGAMATRSSARDMAAVLTYAKNLGLAFQVVDDIIDATATSVQTGKDAGQDLKKTTFVSFSGVEGARSLARELVDASVEALTPFGRRGARLQDLALYVLERRR